MNVQTSLEPGLRQPDDPTPEAALDMMRHWLTQADPQARERLEADLRALLATADRPVGPGHNAAPFSRDYPADFRPDDAYKASMPDLQNGPSSLIRGAKTIIQHVGISNFRLPIRYLTREGEERLLETSVTGTVSLEAEKKGINMSRIMRSFYAHAEDRFSFDVIDGALSDYRRDLDSFDARIQLRMSWPMRIDSLRSGLSGWQYYDVALELVDNDGLRRRIMHVDYVYSSTCPCSLELSEHARAVRNQLATPHSQRSVARISVEILPGADLPIEDLIELLRRGVVTETQVMVKREDEQAFAELNAANPIFVEDAARSFCQVLREEPRIGDFRVIASHQESLHSHDAVSLLTEGPLFAATSLDPTLFASLIHRG